MKTARHNRIGVQAILAVAVVGAMCTSSAMATGHFDQYQDPNYNFGIYAGPIGNEGCGAWTMSGHLLTRGNGTINEFDPSATGLHQGTSVHPVLTSHVITGLANGAGITNGTDGYLYTVGTTGLQRVDPNNWALPAVNMPNTVTTPGYGINTLPNGKIVYTDSSGNSNVYVYDPVSQVNTLIYTAPTLIDDMETGPGGEIALAGQGNGSIIIINSSGGLIKQFNTARYPDGLAFGAGPFGNSVYANNNDGSITRYDFGSPGYQGTVTPVDIATSLPGHRGYGDLATVGPDCAFYIGTFANSAIHGNDAGIGTNWDNGVTNGENSIVRVGFNDLTGLPNSQCAFYSLVETITPEPATLALLAMGGFAIIRRRRAA
ncbi:MAG: PEP-CTERM sorting domain-containing protein [Planctomycetota bacterium]|nr:PEP-CTERM sorting domain-containing protein [Planctomycetota bacterium]